jgi:hypothetical protein
MIRSGLIMMFVSVIILSSCGSRRSRVEHRDLIPEKDLVAILRDIYITDGLLAMPRISIKYSPLDSASTYNHVIEEHGYTKEAMDRTMKYYFVRNPRKLIRIYDKVLADLSEMESRVQKQVARTKPKLSGLWKGNDYYTFPDPSGSDSTDFSVILDKAGFYILSATVTLHPDDQSYRPALIAFACHADSLATGKRTYNRPFYYISDGQPHKYRYSFKVPPKSRLYLKGSLFVPENNPEPWEKHVHIQNITLNHSPFDL